MSTQTSSPNKDRSRGKRFQPTGSIAIFDESDFAAMRQPTDDELTHDTQLFAVACRDGIAQDITDEREFEALAVLYLTADGEAVVEKHIRAIAGDREPIPRVITAPDEMLTRATGFATRIAPVVRRHPEVGDG